MNRIARLRSLLLAAPGLILLVGIARAQAVPALRIVKVSTPITLDGVISDAEWSTAIPVETWYETNPGDNVEPKVRNVAYLAYDERYLYAAFEFYDPNVRAIRAPYADRDNVSSSTDYGGLILNPSNDRKTAVLLLANPRGIQYDAISSDVSGEDSSPDFYWDSAGRIGTDRWTLEIRVPFSSLRYPDEPVPQWGILLYRNWPRDRRYQMFSSRLPRDVSCFICNSAPLEGLESLPESSHLTAAPFMTTSQQRVPSDGFGSPLESESPEFDAGIDVKWSPNAETVLDATVNPDFSQIESDVAVISANERFAIFLPEKRPFFLESVDLFSTPFQAVYTRSIQEPKWGARATGKFLGTAYTTLITDDEGGGVVIIPGPLGSDFASQDFESLDFIGRARHDLGKSFVSLLVAARQNDDQDGGGYNRVFGPDFQWRPNDQDWITGQFLWSRSETPNRPDLAQEWDGRELDGYAGFLDWFRGTRNYDVYARYKELGDEFRADLGFIPQVGYQDTYAEAGWTFRPEDRFFSRIRTFVLGNYSEDLDDTLLFQRASFGAGMDGRLNSFMRYQVMIDKVRASTEVFDRRQLHYTLQAVPSKVFNFVSLYGWVGEEVDFANERLGDGARVALDATIRPTDHLELVFNNEWRILDIEPTGERLFTAEFERIKATYTFSTRSFLRLIGQHVRTDRDASLYEDPVPEHTGGLTLSALYAYKINWQTVLFVGLGDNHALTEDENWEETDQQFFVKVSYAFQR